MRLSLLAWFLTGLSGSDSSFSSMSSVSSSSVKQPLQKRTLVKKGAALSLLKPEISPMGVQMGQNGRWKMGRVLAAGVLSVLMLSACGQKGELYLPEDDASSAVVDEETVQLGYEVSSDPNDF